MKIAVCVMCSWLYVSAQYCREVWGRALPIQIRPSEDSPVSVACSTAFSALLVTESWAGSGYEAVLRVVLRPSRSESIIVIQNLYIYGLYYTYQSHLRLRCMCLLCRM